MTKTNKLVVIMGVSGCGKSTVAESFAAQLDMQMIDADDHHTDSALAKMRSGIALSDKDREPWFTNLHKQVVSYHNQGKDVVLACSALKHRYRNIFRKWFLECYFVWLRLDKQTVIERIQKRKGHFFDPSLVQNQFDILEEPTDEANVITINAAQDKQQILKKLVAQWAIEYETK